MAKIICTQCHKEIDDTLSTCPHCGNPLSKEEKTTIANSDNRLKKCKVLFSISLASLAFYFFCVSSFLFVIISAITFLWGYGVAKSIKADKEAAIKAVQEAERKKNEEEKLKEIESLWPYGTDVVWAVGELDQEGQGIRKIRSVQMSFSNGYQLTVGDKKYKIFVKPSGLIAQLGDDYCRISSSEIDIDGKWLICNGDSSLEYIPTFINQAKKLVNEKAFIKKEQSDDITDSEILEMVKKYHFKFDGSSFCSDDYNLGRKFVNQILDSLHEFFPRILFEYYNQYGLHYFNVTKTDDLNRSKREICISTDKIGILKFASDNSVKDYELPSEEPVEWAVTWAYYEIYFQYFKHLISANTLCLNPNSVLRHGKYLVIEYINSVDKEALPKKNNFNMGVEFINKQHSNCLETLRKFSNINAVVSLFINTETSEIDHVIVLGQSFVAYEDNATNI